MSFTWLAITLIYIDYPIPMMSVRERGPKHAAGGPVTQTRTTHGRTRLVQVSVALDRKGEAHRRSFYLHEK